jgi:hypothetical protein
MHICTGQKFSKRDPQSVPYEQLLSIINLSNLKQRRIYQSLQLLYKFLFCNGPSYIRDLFHFRKTKYSLRGDGYILALPKFNLQWKKKSFSYAAAKYWNELPVIVLQSADFNSFRSNLRNVVF